MMNTHGIQIQNDPDDAVQKSRFQKITNKLGAVGKKVNSFGRHVVGTLKGANQKLLHGNVDELKQTASREAAALAGWKEPSFLDYDECKNPKNTNNWVKRCKNVHGKRISANDQMLNFRREVKNPQNEGTAINYESRKKRYWRSTNYHKANHKYPEPYVLNSDGSVIPIRGSTKVFYTAKAPRLHGAETIQMRYHNASNPEIKDRVEGISLEKYQKMLQDPATRAQANAELVIFKQMLIDARTMKREALEAKYNKIKTVESIASSLGMIFGTAAGSGVSSAVTTGIGYASQAVSAASLVSGEGHAVREAASVLKTTLGVAGKVAASVVIGTVLGVSGAGFPLAVLAVVSTAATVGAHVAGKQVAKKMLKAELDSDETVKLIDEMLKKDGIIEENNPMFANARRVKNILNAAKSRGENVNSLINTMPNTNKKLARNLLKQMKEPNTGPQKQRPTSMFNKRVEGGRMRTYKRKRT